MHTSLNTYQGQALTRDRHIKSTWRGSDRGTGSEIYGGFLGCRFKTDGPEVNLLEEDRLTPVNEFLFLYKGHELPTARSGFEIMACLWRPPFSPIQMKVKSG